MRCGPIEADVLEACADAVECVANQGCYDAGNAYHSDV